MNANRVGIFAALILGGWHLLWSLLVMSGAGQVIWDFILWAHMVHMQVTIGPFDPLASAILIIVTAGIGYALGSIGALVWNRLHDGR